MRLFNIFNYYDFVDRRFNIAEIIGEISFKKGKFSLLDISHKTSENLTECIKILIEEAEHKEGQRKSDRKLIT